MIEQISLQPVNILQVVFAFTAAFGALLLWPNERFRGLCIILSLDAVLMLFNLLEETNVTREYYLLTPIFTLTTGPAFYLFTRHLVYPKLAWHKSEWLHFMPATIALCFTGWPQWVIAIGSLSLITYGVLAFILLMRYHRAAKAMRSDAESLQLVWLQKVFLLIACLMAIDLVRLNLQPYLSLALLMHWYFINQLISFGIIATMIYKALNTPELFDELAIFEQSIADSEAAKEACSTATEQALYQQVFTEVKQRIEQEQLFKQPRLALKDLAELTGFSLKDISTAINRCGQCSYSDLVNGYRVAEVQQQIQTGKAQNRNLLDLGLASGFNSKSSFNAIFKKYSGKTPSQYLKQVSNA